MPLSIRRRAVGGYAIGASVGTTLSDRFNDGRANLSVRLGF